VPCAEHWFCQPDRALPSVYEGHGLWTWHIGGLTASADTLKCRRQPVLPSPHAVVRCQSVLDEQQPTIWFEYAAHLAERAISLRNSAKRQGHDHGLPGWRTFRGSKPTVKQKLAAVRMLYDFLVVRQIMPSNPAHSVLEPKYVVNKGKTPKRTGFYPKGFCVRLTGPGAHWRDVKTVAFSIMPATFTSPLDISVKTDI
jgi:hypothetical protein